jgi:PAS domain-containing protein
MKPRIKDSFNTGNWVESLFQCKDGSRLQVEIFASPMVFHGEKAIILNVRDLTGSKRFGEKLIESEKRYRELFENIPSGFVLFGVIQNDEGEPVDLKIITANKMFSQTTGI